MARWIPVLPNRNTSTKAWAGCRFQPITHTPGGQPPLSPERSQGWGSVNEEKESSFGRAWAGRALPQEGAASASQEVPPPPHDPSHGSWGASSLLTSILVPKDPKSPRPTEPGLCQAGCCFCKGLISNRPRRQPRRAGPDLTPLRAKFTARSGEGCQVPWHQIPVRVSLPREPRDFHTVSPAGDPCQEGPGDPRNLA